jgi:hypothetical protein
MDNMGRVTSDHWDNIDAGMGQFGSRIGQFFDHHRPDLSYGQGAIANFRSGSRGTQNYGSVNAGAGSTTVFGGLMNLDSNV